MTDHLSEDGSEEVPSLTSITEDLIAIREKLTGHSQELLEEMIDATQRNPDEQIRAIERLLEMKLQEIGKQVGGEVE